MTTVTDKDIRELKDPINSRFNELDKKIEVNQAVTNEKFLLINEKFSSLNGRLDTMQAIFSTELNLHNRSQIAIYTNSLKHN